MIKEKKDSINKKENVQFEEKDFKNKNEETEDINIFVLIFLFCVVVTITIIFFRISEKEKVN